jgi:hypothetical protein
MGNPPNDPWSPPAIAPQPFPPPQLRAAGVGAAFVAVLLLATGRGDAGLIFTGVAFILGFADLAWTVVGTRSRGYMPPARSTYPTDSSHTAPPPPPPPAQH